MHDRERGAQHFHESSEWQHGFDKDLNAFQAVMNAMQLKEGWEFEAGVVRRRTPTRMPLRLVTLLFRSSRHHERAQISNYELSSCTQH